MIYARRTDLNHRAVVAALRKIGCHVLDLSKVGHGCPDLLVRIGYKLRFLELKNPDGRNRVEPAQRKFHDDWRGFVSVVHSAEEAVREMTR